MKLVSAGALLLLTLLYQQPIYTVSAWVSTPVLVEEWEGGTTVPTSGVRHTFTGLDARGITPYYLRVEIMPTDMDNDYEYADISVNGRWVLEIEIET